MNPILYEIITTLLTACGIAIAGFVIPYLRKAAQAAEAKLRNSDHELAAEIIREAVHAVEQTIQGFHRGDEKYDAASKEIHDRLAEKGISLTDSEIDTMIEAVVGQMNKDKKPAEQ